MKQYLLIALVVLLFPAKLLSQFDGPIGQLKADNIFGMTATVSYQIPSKHNRFQIAGTYWFNPSFGTLTTGADQMLSTWVGYAIPAGNSGLTITPWLGFNHGKYFSGGTTSSIFESVTPELKLLYRKPKLEINAMCSYSTPIQNKGDIWKSWFRLNVSPEFKLGESFMAGVVYEMLNLGVHYSQETDVLKNFRGIGASLAYKRSASGIRFQGGYNLSTTREFTAPTFYRLITWIQF